MTPEQRELARHALGLPNDRNMSYRNRFYANSKNSNFPPWMAMVKAGEADFGGRMFWLTLAGATLAINPGERLDREDFPTPPIEGA